MSPQGRSGRVWKVLSVRGLDPRTVQPVASCCSVTCVGLWKRRTFRPALLYRCLQWPLLFKRCTSNSECASDAILFPSTGTGIRYDLLPNTDTGIRCDSIHHYRYGHQMQFCSPILLQALAILFPSTGTGFQMRFYSPRPVRALDAILFTTTGTGIRCNSFPQYCYRHQRFYSPLLVRAFRCDSIPQDLYGHQMPFYSPVQVGHQMQFFSPILVRPLAILFHNTGTGIRCHSIPNIGTGIRCHSIPSTGTGIRRSSVPNTGTGISDSIPRYRYGHLMRFCFPRPIRTLGAILFPNTGRALNAILFPNSGTGFR